MPMRLLVIEDNEKLASLMKKLLSDNAFAVDAMATAEEAKAALAVAEYDLIVLDLSLPDQDGTELLRSLRRAGHGTPVLVATARADVVQRVQTLNDGADDY
jgi:DNA-binding response OmpR family regulator